MSADPADIPADDGELATYGDRIEQLLAASAAAGPGARERAEEAVRLVVDLYGAGLERLLELLHTAGALPDATVERIAADDLVASLLLVHGLHPYGVGERVRRAVERAGGGAELVGMDAAGVVRLRVAAGGGCGSAQVPVETVEAAILAAAPEVTGVAFEQAPTGLVSLESLTASLHREPA